VKANKPTNCRQDNLLEHSTNYWEPISYTSDIDVPKFPVYVFPPLLQEYCIGTAKSMITTPDYVGTAMLGVASAAIGQSVYISIKDRWVESPLLNLLIVGTPGRMKTPVLKEVSMQ
jgi:hypothetical protein